VRPRVVRVDALRQRAELVRQRCKARPVGVAHPGEVVAHVAPVREHPGVLTGQLGKGRHDGEPELLRETEVRLVEGTDHLAAELNDAAVGQGGLLHAAAGPVAGLDDEHVRARIHKIACCAEAGEPGAHDHNVAFTRGILS
jgi:hypothetical protein